MDKLKPQAEITFRTKVDMTKRLFSDVAPVALDDIDRALIAALAEDARIAVSELARRVGLSAPSTADRLRRLDAQGVIERFTVPWHASQRHDFAATA